MSELLQRKIYPEIQKSLFKGKVIILYGARQVGKTTIAKQLQKEYQGDYFNCDEPDIRQAFSQKTSTELKQYLANKKFIILDEAQRIKDIGLSLKLLVDNYPEIQIIATGSSSFDLSNSIKEPLTGRKYEFFLYPFAIEELQAKYSNLELQRLLKDRLIYGSYPEIVQDPVNATQNLLSISNSYLYKDILAWQQIKNPEILDKLLKALALQIGSEVSYNELASLLQIDKNTVMHYLDILEKAFIVFRLNPYSSNLRNELKKLRKVYFYDLGIRNALVNNFNPLDLRNDSGALFENFVISEIKKLHNNHNSNVNTYFWRNHNKQEIDLIIEQAGKLFATEIKWNKSQIKIPLDFSKNYPDSQIQIINQNNWISALTSI
ncbi:MAG TPA: ATP-binding protein [Candidatus Gracilibacteria bacterium]|nr:ATP-binding protein [Candidatus Gracilibacteria bacterium]